MTSQGSIDNYISGARTLYKLSGVSDKHFDSIELKLTRKGLARLNPHMPFRAHPVTPTILLKIFNILDLSVDSECVFWCLFLTAFFTMSRKSNLVLSEKSKQYKMITRNNITVKDGIIFMEFLWSKTNQFGRRTHIVPLVPIPNSVLCPVIAYHRMIERVPAQPSDPLFMLRVKRKSSKPVTYFQFQSFFKQLISLIGLNSSDFSTHSFRRGGATWAFHNNVPGELIQNHGDWASSAYLLYLDLSLEKKLDVSKAMSSPL